MIPNDKKQKKEKKSKGGRPRKDRTGLPQVDIVSAINYTKKAYETIRTNLKSFKGLREAMGMEEAFARRALGEIRDYGLIEQENNGWKVSDLGRRSSEGDVNAVIQIVQKAEIIGDLFDNLKDKAVERDYIEDFIKKKRYKYKIKIPSVADRFIQIINYIKDLEPQKKAVDKGKEIDRDDFVKWVKIIQLKYALNPPKEEISKLADDIAKEFKDTDDIAVKTLINQIKANRSDNKILGILVNSLIDILTDQYPIQVLQLVKESEPNKEEKRQKTSEKPIL